MLVRLLLVTILIVMICFLTLSFRNPLAVEFDFFGKLVPTDLSVLMMSSFVLGATLVFIGYLTRDAKKALEGLQRTREEKKSQSLKEDYDRGIHEFLRGNLGKAKTHFMELLKRDPTQIDLYLRLSEIHLKEGRSEDALHWLQRASLIDMRNVDILLRQASIYQQTNRVEDAIRTLHRAISLDETNVEAIRLLREIYRRSRKWQEAIDLQKSILKIVKGKQAEQEETLFLMGLRYELANDLLARGGEGTLEKALKEAKEIISEGKTFQPGRVLLGDIYLRLGKWATAGKVWGKGYSRFKSMIFLQRLEDLYLGRGDPSTLLRIYQHVLRNEPYNWAASFYYAKLCLRLEMLDEALEEINEISMRQKDFPALHRLLAEIYLHKKDFSRAAQEFEKTFEMSGTSYLSFVCSACERESKEWVAYCPQCRQWNTYTIEKGERKAPLPAASFSEWAANP